MEIIFKMGIHSSPKINKLRKTEFETGILNITTKRKTNK